MKSPRITEILWIKADKRSDKLADIGLKCTKLQEIGSRVGMVQLEQLSLWLSSTIDELEGGESSGSSVSRTSGAKRARLH